MTDSARTPFEQVLQSLELDAKTLEHAVDATFIPERGGARDSPLDSLPIVAVAGDAEGNAELALHGVLGEGGRGEIRLGTQLSLRRRVAVKTLKGESGAAPTQELLREARITGNLEHPNVVPVYALGRDVHDRVLLMMKQVKGEPWGRILRNETVPRSDAQIERHLEIFRQVCNAVEFAHSEGIVHRDLKPDNIMVGAFGEVVVLDWGLAVSLQGDPARGLPPASAYRGLAGTPAYMAPELVSGEGARVGRWTDVYLLGAIVHEIVTGAPPHQSASVPEALERAYVSAPPSYTACVPDELVEICRRAMQPEPEARFGSVAELREAVQAFSRHRLSAQLAAEARARLEAVPPLEAGLAANEAAAAHAALAQSRFGFEQALRSWPENPVARVGLRTALERQVELELALGSLAGAERALAELTAPDPALAEKVEGLRRRLAAEHAELEQLRALQRELDPGATQGIRNVLLGGCGLLWFILPVSTGIYERVHHVAVGPRAAGVAMLAFAASSAVAFWVAKREIFANRMGRNLALMVATFITGAALVRLSATLLGRPIHEELAYEMVVYGVSAAAGAIFIDARFVLAAVVFAAASPLIALRPDLSLFVVGATNFLALVPMTLFWNRLRRLNCDASLLVPGAEVDQPRTRRAQSA